MGARRGARPEERLKSTHAQQAQKPKPKKAVCVELDFGFGLGLLSVFLCIFLIPDHAMVNLFFRMSNNSHTATATMQGFLLFLWFFF